MTYPVIILSIGKVGGAALKDIAYYLSPTSNVQLGGICLGIPPELDESIKWYQIDADVEELRGLYNTIDEMPDVGDWFNPGVLRTLSDEQPTPEQRQLGRLIFYQHLTSNNQTLAAFIKNLEDKARADEGVQTETTLQVHVLISMDELEGMAWTLDILNALHFAFSRQAAVVLHIALPKAALNAYTHKTQAHMAAGFAMMRELKRHVVSYGGMTQLLYPADSPLSGYNAQGIRMMASAVKLYSYRNGSVVEQWADVLLALVDGDDQQLLTKYEEVRINVPFSRFALDDRYALMVGVYEAKSAIFPRIPMQRQFVNVLTETIIKNLVGSEKDCQAIPQSSLKATVTRQWLKPLLLTADGREVRCPHIMELGLNESSALSEYMSLESVLELLDVKAYHIEDADHPVFTWGADSVEVVRDRQKFIDAVDVHLERLFVDYTMQTDGMYASTLNHIVAIQHQAFEESLQIFILNYLNDEANNVRCLARIMQQIIQPVFQKLNRHLARILARQTSELRNAHVKENLRKTKQQLRHTRTFRNTIHDDVPRFWAYLDAALLPIKQYHAWKALMSLTEKMEASFDHLHERIQKWADLLWLGDESLLTSSLKNQQAFFIPTATPTRYILFDDAWELHQREALLRKYQPEFEDSFEWHIDDEGLLALGFNTELVETDFHSLTPNPKLGKKYYEQLREIVESLVKEERLTMWEHYLNLDDRKKLHQDNLLDFFMKQTLKWDMSESGIDYFFSIPSRVAHESNLDAHINSYIRSINSKELNTVYVEDGTRLVLLATNEQLPAITLRDYQNLENAYIKLERGTQADLHILRPEVEAIYLQVSAYTSLNQTVQFSGDVVALLSHRKRIEDFIRLLALDFIELKSSKIDQHSYVLYDTNRNRYWWLPTRHTGEYLYRALETYCLDNRGVEYGASDNLVLLPRAEVDDWVETKIEQIEKETRHIRYEGRNWEMVYDLINYRGQHIEVLARKTGHIIARIEKLQDKLKRELNVDLSRQEYETRLLLIILVQDMVRHQRDILHEVF